MREISRRLVELEKRQPSAPRRVAIIAEDAQAPADADFIIRLVPATMETIAESAGA